MNNMTRPKFKVGDRVRVAKIDDYDFYGDANFEINCIGTICVRENHGDYIYRVKFDDNQYNTSPYHPENYWALLEDWLEKYSALIYCE